MMNPERLAALLTKLVILSAAKNLRFDKSRASGASLMHDPSPSPIPSDSCSLWDTKGIDNYECE
jgi:hypothetical protein